jgi:hypothetical protein
MNVRNILGVTLLALGLLIAALYFYPESWPLYNLVNTFYSNLSSELFGIALTVLLIDALYELRQAQQLKAQLIREMRSPDNGIALRAVEELRAYGWLSDGSMKGSDLHKANLVEADLHGANLDGCDLRNANLKNVSLREASLIGTNLLGANLQGALLRRANLSQTILSNANLSNAILVNANLVGSKLDGIVYNNDTKWPDKFRPPKRSTVNRIA